MTWDLELPNSYNNGCKNDFFTSAGDVIIVGESATATSFNFDPAITRLDTAGTIKWSYVYNTVAPTGRKEIFNPDIYWNPNREIP